MLQFILDLVTALRVFFTCRVDLALEILALRQQVAVLKRKRPRPQLSGIDRLFWTPLRGIWPRWAEVLLIVKPETVVGWHRAGFRLLLALAVSRTGRRQSQDHPGNSGTHLPHGTREYNLGRTQDPRRAAETRLRALRTIGLLVTSRGPRSGHKVQHRCSEHGALNRTEAQAHQPRISLAERSGGTLGWKAAAGSCWTM